MTRPWRTAPRKLVADEIVLVPVAPSGEVEEGEGTAGRVSQCHQGPAVEHASAGAQRGVPLEAEHHRGYIDEVGADAERRAQRHLGVDELGRFLRSHESSAWHG